MSNFDDFNPGSIPVGAGMDYWGTTAPAGWLFAYGQSVSRATYPALFARLGTTYGAVDGSSFNLPDKRGRVSISRDNMGGSAASRVTAGGSGIDGTNLGASGGAQNLTLLAANIPPLTLGFASGGTAITNAGNSGQLVSGGGIATVGIDTSGVVGAGPTPAADMPPGIVCNYIIYVGVT